VKHLAPSIFREFVCAAGECPDSCCRAGWEIVIDPDRCPLTFTEFTLKEFERDKEGNWIDEIPDGNDHSIDAVRYAMLDDCLRG
jgi:hypothetical protein